MTGLDCLREEMEKRGLKKVQIESRTAAVVLDILANSGDKYEQMQKNESDKSAKLKSIESEVRWHEQQLRYLKKAVDEWNKEAEKAREHRKHCEAYIDEFNKSLQECETAEGRDAMRTAQMFVNTVSVDTKYDNTAYIIGLASILSNWNTNAIDQLKKINKELPTVRERSRFVHV